MNEFTGGFESVTGGRFPLNGGLTMANRKLLDEKPSLGNSLAGDAATAWVIRA